MWELQSCVHTFHQHSAFSLYLSAFSFQSLSVSCQSPAVSCQTQGSRKVRSRILDKSIQVRQINAEQGINLDTFNGVTVNCFGLIGCMLSFNQIISIFSSSSLIKIRLHVVIQSFIREGKTCITRGGGGGIS